jgi:diaminohydroxyphosphoribosylaminopyrimidine deaminase/5-amino-6-(5-phosphoribosylamino)uracil reductase
VSRDRLDDAGWLGKAIDLAHRCPPAGEAFCVGAVIVATDGTVLATGFSRESDSVVHAEEAALAKLDGDARLATATLYSSLEPCGERRSRPKTCARLIIEAGITRVVYAWREPDDFVSSPHGHRALVDAGIEVIELPNVRDPFLRHETG